MQKPTNFNDLLKLQKILDETVYEQRENGFIPRKRTEFDLRMAIDDEFNEFMKELPPELNFKTWKEIEYDPKKQLIEFVDCLFFILGALNDFKESYGEYFLDIVFENFDNLTEFEIKRYKEEIEKIWFSESEKTEIFKESLDNFKMRLHCDLSYQPDFEDVINAYFDIAMWLGYSKEIILEAYWDKWKKNMKRIKGDWSL